MIIRSIETLLSCGIERIILGTGYKKEAYEALQADFPQIETCFSPRYADTNSMYTLYNTRDVIGDDSFLLLESDLVFERKAILSLLDDEFPDVMLVSSLTKFQDQYYVEYDCNHILTSCSVDKDALEAKGELVGIHKLPILSTAGCAPIMRPSWSPSLNWVTNTNCSACPVPFPLSVCSGWRGLMV